MKIFNISDLARLSDTISLLFKSFLGIKLKCLFHILKKIAKYHETYNNGPGSTLSMITMNNNYIFRIL
jgi:hypothetical protein